MSSLPTPRCGCSSWSWLTNTRTHRVKVGATTVSEYAYLGTSSVVGTELPQPDVFSRRWTGASTYGELDRFNRPVTWTWTKDLSTDVPFYDVDVAYDENGNITRTEDNVHTAGAAGSGNGLFDVAYTMDGVGRGRLTQALEGHWGGSAITVAKRDENWALEHTGNWEFFRQDSNGLFDV